MLSVVICDDETAIRAMLRNYMGTLAREMGQLLEIREFSSGEALLTNYNTGTDILLIDIQMGEMDGLEAIRKIRTIDRDVCVVFITNMINYAIACYKVRAFGFLRKPLGYEEFRMEMRDAVTAALEKGDKSVTLRNGSEIFKFSTRDIGFVETDGHKIILHTAKGPVALPMSINEAERSMPQDFLRCHVSYLVNYAHIAQVGYSELQLDSGEHIPISKHRRKAFLAKLTNCVGRNF